MRFDLLIRGGVLVDGTGLPRRRADLGIRNGRVAAIGLLAPRDAERTLDADGRVVAPGIVDPHTHYDPQLTFDPYATSSCFHGVTASSPATVASHSLRHALGTAPSPRRSSRGSRT